MSWWTVVTMASLPVSFDHSTLQIFCRLVSYTAPMPSRLRFAPPLCLQAIMFVISVVLTRHGTGGTFIASILCRREQIPGMREATSAAVRREATSAAGRHDGTHALGRCAEPLGGKSDFLERMRLGQNGYGVFNQHSVGSAGKPG